MNWSWVIQYYNFIIFFSCYLFAASRYSWRFFPRHQKYVWPICFQQWKWNWKRENGDYGWVNRRKGHTGSARFAEGIFFQGERILELMVTDLITCIVQCVNMWISHASVWHDLPVTSHCVVIDATLTHLQVQWEAQTWFANVVWECLPFHLPHRVHSIPSPASDAWYSILLVIATLYLSSRQWTLNHRKWKWRLIDVYTNMDTTCEHYRLNATAMIDV